MGRAARPGVLVAVVLVVLALVFAVAGGDDDAATPTAAATPRTDATTIASATTPAVARTAATVPGATPAAASTTTAEAPSALPLAGRTVVVDPGHNGANAANPSAVNRQVRIGNGSKACDTTGTASVLGQSEHAYTWSVARQVRLALEDAGARVILTRRDDRGVGPCITRRMPRANAANADLAVSIHGDGGPSGGRGFHVILPGKVPSIARHDRIVAPSARLGRAVRAAFRSGTGMPYSTYLGSRGLDVRTDLGGLNLIRVPGVMIETGNMRNATDARLMAEPSWRRRAGAAIAAGITTWLTAEAR